MENGDDTYGVTTGIGTTVCETFPYNHLLINFYFIWLDILSKTDEHSCQQTPLMDLRYLTEFE